MNNIEKMIQNTIQTIDKIKEHDENKKNEELKLQEQRKTTNYDASSREAIMITSLGLNIDMLEWVDKDQYGDTVELYYCSNERWNLLIRNLLYDPDLGTCLQVVHLIDKKTEQKINFDCDLLCENTFRLKNFKILLNCSVEEYIEKEFGVYYSLPSLLRTKGFTVKENNFTFNVDQCEGSLIVKNESISNRSCEIIINHKHQIISYLRNIVSNRIYQNNISYNFSYKGEKDIDVLSDIINAFIEHIDNKFGYLEDNIYYSNENLETLFNSYKKKFNELYDKTTNCLFKYYKGDIINPDLMEEYSKMNDFITVDHYKGVEIYKKYGLHLNRKAIDEGGIDNVYTFEIIYNKNINEKECILNVTSTIQTFVGYDNLTDDSANLIKSEDSAITLTGNYTFIENTIKQFLDAFIQIK